MPGPDPSYGRFPYPFTVLTLVFGPLLFVAMVGALYLLYQTSKQQDFATRQNFLQRDLRTAVSAFDSEERYVLANNLWAFWHERRPLRPLMLPRHYYAALPRSSGIEPPRPPPQNCFVNLFHVGDITPTSDAFCSYLTSDPTMGRYLYIMAVFQADSVSPHRVGDTSLNGDGLELTARNTYATRHWKIVLQPPAQTDSPRYELSAYLTGPSGQLERDKAIEGWAYTQRQVTGNLTINLLARIDARLLAPTDDAFPEQGATWPGPILRSTAFQVSRLFGGSSLPKKGDVPYESTGATRESLPLLYKDFPGARATLSLLTGDASGPEGGAPIARPADDLTLVDDSHSIWARLDSVVTGKQEPLVRNMPIADTNLTLRVEYLGPSLQNGFYFLVADLLLLATAYLFLGLIFLGRLIIPMQALAKRARGTDGTATGALPYEDRRNELGSLVRAFNSMLSARAERVLADEQLRAARESEAVRSRDQALKTIGHEIRSPLQTLLARHPMPEDPTRRLLLRTSRAITHLYGGAGPEAVFASIPLTLSDHDIAKFAASCVSGLTLAGTQGIAYRGPSGGIICRYDEFALEDVVEHIVSNACRYRRSGSVIQFTLTASADSVELRIKNEGEAIPDGALERIFDYGFSLAPESEDSLGQGLYVAMNHVTRMGGRLSAANVVDGVEFIVEIPRATHHKSP